MAGEQSFKAVVNDTKPSSKGRSYSMEISGLTTITSLVRRLVIP